MGSYYEINTKINKEDLINKLSNYNNFFIEQGSGYFDQISTSSRITKVFITKIDEDTYQISENAGLGDMFQIIGELKIIEFHNETDLILNYSFGVMNYNIPIIFGLLFLIASLLFFIVGESVVGFIVLVISGIIFLWWFSKIYMIKYFNKQLKDALGIDFD